MERFSAVHEALVFGVPDEMLGEEVGASIYMEEGATANAAELRDYCREHIAAYKIPRYIWFVDAPLPRNANGKFLKKSLREGLDVASAR